MPTTEKDETGWWVRCDEIASLYKYLCATDRLDPSDVNAVVRFLSKPYNWSTERAEMLARRTANDADEKPSRLSLVRGRR
jgi:hypothetical protein